MPLAQTHKDGADFLLLFPLLPLILDQQPDPTHPDQLHCIFIVAWIAHRCKPGNAWHTGHALSDWKGVPFCLCDMTLMSLEVTWGPVSTT